jgi:plastocyanin
MNATLRHLLAGAACAGFLAGCSFEKAPCSSGTCNGCCDPNQGCVSGTADTQCGAKGAACVDCTASSHTCTAQSCNPPGEDGGPGDGGTPDAGPTDAGPGDAGQPVDSGTPDAGVDAGTDAGAFQALSPCTTPGMYATTGAAIQFGGVLGKTYSPNCLTVTAGSKVYWEGAFASHPLRPSSRGSQPNPIPSVSTGTDSGVVFANPGFYPFYCALHGNDGGTTTAAGSNMSGVIQVIP